MINRLEIIIHCLNDPEFLSISYIAIKGDGEVSSAFIDKLLSRSWSVWIFTDRGKL